MKKYKDIDELFIEGASGFEVSPSEKVWKGIDAAAFNTGSVASYSYKKWIIAASLLLISGLLSTWYFVDWQNETDLSDKIIIDSNLNENNTEVNKNISNTELVTRDEIGVEEIENEQNEFLIIEKTIEQPIVEDPYTEVVIVKPENKEYETYSGDNKDGIIGVTSVESRSIYDIASLDYSIGDRKITLEEYVAKRKKYHTYTGLGIKPAMVYYPNTQDQFTYTAEANIGIIINKFYIETGIGYQQMNEKGVYKFTYKSNDSIGVYNRVVSFEIDPENPDEINYKTTETTVYDSIEHHSLQSPTFKYSYLNIPLKVGYKFWENNKLSLGIETGLLFSKLMSSEIPKPEFNNPEYSLLRVEDNSPTRVDINLQMLVALRVNYRLNGAVSISVQPEFTKYLNSIYNIELGGPNTKPYTMGMRFGIYYDF